MEPNNLVQENTDKAIPEFLDARKREELPVVDANEAKLAPKDEVLVQTKDDVGAEGLVEA